MANIHAQIVSATADETGGAHNQKGVEFQRNWAIIKMFALEDDGAKDYLLLFEALQDVAVLDSATDPTSAEILQVKKKDRGEWAWGSLTELHMPSAKKKKALSGVAGSMFGKLHGTMRRLADLNPTGRFISNAGCNLDLAGGGNAATSLPIALSKLQQPFQDLLIAAFKDAHPGEPLPDLERLFVERVDLPPGDAATYTVGKATAFLSARSKKHAGQARSFVDSLLAQIGPLGARTETCNTFEDVKRQHGFARKDFTEALSALESLPDYEALAGDWLKQLQSEGLGFRQVTRIRLAITEIYKRRVMGNGSNFDDTICDQCDAWLTTQADPTNLLPFLTSATTHLTALHPTVREAELQAYLLLRAVEKCADQTFAS